MNRAVYCKSRKRRPISFRRTPFFHDRQGELPIGWCSRCGSEIFVWGQEQCSRCRDGKGEDNE